MENEINQGIVSMMPLLFEVLGVTIAVSMDKYIKKIKLTFLLIVLILITTLVLENFADYILSLSRVRSFPRILLSIYGYIGRPIVIVLFYYIVDDEKKSRFPRYLPFWILIGINSAISLTALFTDICFTMNENNHFDRGPLGYSCHVTCAICLVYLLYHMIRTFGVKDGTDVIMPVFCVVLVGLGILADLLLTTQLYHVTFTMTASVSAILLYYIWLHLQYLREHERLLLAEQRVQIMMSQIQPHFIYNTLSTIQALCRRDPQKAFEVTEKFGRYLRKNLNLLKQPDMIPLEKEIEHTRVYAEIEKVRFPNIDVIYEIRDVDFLLPALTIQPLVENAIKHGVRIRKHGMVRILTECRQGTHIITVEDNGKGFDKNKAVRERGGEEYESGEHIGLKNVQERIELMCEGSMEIKSEPDKGTTIRIVIP